MAPHFRGSEPPRRHRTREVRDRGMPLLHRSAAERRGAEKCANTGVPAASLRPCGPAGTSASLSRSVAHSALMVMSPRVCPRLPRPAIGQCQAETAPAPKTPVVYLTPVVTLALPCVVEVGGPDLSQMEPIDELDAADREFQDRRVAPLLNVDQPLCHFRVVRAYLSVSTTYSIVRLGGGLARANLFTIFKENSGDRQTTR